MNLVLQQHENGCGVAVFAMLTDRTWDEAAEFMRFTGDPVPFAMLRAHLQNDGAFVRAICKPDEGDEWPPRPFAPRHMACVTQPSGGGHYLAVEKDGTVLDPLRDGRYQLSDWKVVHEVCGVLRFRLPVSTRSDNSLVRLVEEVNERLAQEALAEGIPGETARLHQRQGTIR